MVRLISYSLAFKCWESTAVVLLVWLWTHCQMPHPKDGKNQLRFQRQNFTLNLLEISRSSPGPENSWCGYQQKNSKHEKLAALTGDLSIISKGKVIKADPKNPYFVINTGQPVSATKSITLFWWSRRFIYFFLFYFSIVIDNAKPTYFDSVNSNIYSFILSLLKLYGIFSFMRWMHCIYLTLT